MVDVYEKWESRQTTEGDTRSVELVYTVQGTDDDLQAKAAVLQTAPVFYDGMIRQSLRMERVAQQHWEATVRYGEAKIPAVGESTYQFDTGGGTQHITHSLETVGRYAPPGKNVPESYGAIGATEDNVEGVDITVPIFNFSETHYLPDSQITNTYKGQLFYLTGKVNQAPFRGFAAGQVLFLGASGSKRGHEDWEITFRFAASPNVTGLTIGNITGINKKGWEYLWVRYVDKVDPIANVLVKEPIAVYVERVYENGDFADLGIGT